MGEFWISIVETGIENPILLCLIALYSRLELLALVGVSSFNFSYLLVGMAMGREIRGSSLSDGDEDGGTNFLVSISGTGLHRAFL